jgi:hypothetical protein
MRVAWLDPSLLGGLSALVLLAACSDKGPQPTPISVDRSAQDRDAENVASRASFAYADYDHGQSVDLSEFRSRAMTVFSYADHDGDGFLDERELGRLKSSAVAAAAVPGLTRARLNDEIPTIFARYDQNHDGAISYDEWVAIPRQTIAWQEHRPIIQH